MAKQTYNVSGTLVRAGSPEAAKTLADEVVSSGTSVIAADSLANTPKNFTPVPVPTPSTSAAGVSSQIVSGADSFLQNLQTDAATKAADKTSSFAELMKGALSSEGQTTIQDRLYSQSVDPAQAELRDINQQILADEVATRRQIEELKKNTEGLAQGAITDKIGEIQDAGLERQADLAVIQMAKQGKYDSAKAIADRAVAAITERQKIKNDALKYAYEEYKSELTTAEQRAFEVAQKDREREADLKTYEVKARLEQSIKQSDPLYQAQLEKARAELTPATQTQTPLDQVTFLRDTIKTAKSLANQSGQGSFTRTFGDIVGGSKYRQLEAQTNTLRTNVLTLATDPSVKKYFGPQMSEADVRLMTAAGTTLNPENLSPQQMRDELTRLDSLFERMQTAVNNGARVEKSGGKLTTAPDGTVIEITD